MTLSDGQDIYCKEYNPDAPVAILLIHGGPGDSSVSFEYLIDELQKDFRIIESDQRGCGRSAWAPSEKITLHRILEDYEEIRTYYGIRKWVLLGHSFGGYLAQRYASIYPQAVSGLIMENPAIDLTDSVRCIIRNYILFFEEWGDEQEVKRLKAALDQVSVSDGLKMINSYPNHIRSEFWKVDCLPHKSLQLLAMVQRIPRYQEKLLHFAEAMSDDPELKANGWKSLHEVICSTLLLYGEWDAITDQDIRSRFLSVTKCGTMQKIEGCGHYIHLGQVKAMYKAITDFTATLEK